MSSPVLVHPFLIGVAVHPIEVGHLADRDARKEAEAMLPRARLGRLLDPREIPGRLPIERRVAVDVPEQRLGDRFAPRERFIGGRGVDEDPGVERARSQDNPIDAEMKGKKSIERLDPAKKGPSSE